MSRLSLRSLWTATRSGLLLSLLIYVGSYVSPLFAQGEYASMGGPVDPMTGAQQQTSTIANRASGIKRTENALGRLQALLYSDVSSIARVNLTKIDYEGLSKFVDSIVDKAGGVVQSSDQYKVELREYQKESAKSSFKKLLSTIQNAAIQSAFKKKIDDMYDISYAGGSDPGCEILAFPIDGLSEADQNAVVDAFSETAITVFKRYGFVIAVVGHDNAVKADLDSIEAKFRAKAEEAQKTNSAYGSYSASGSGNGAYGGSGSSTLSPTQSSMGVSGGLNGSGKNEALANAMGISADLLTDYLEEVQLAKKNARTSSRKAVLPFVRKRFSTPASAEDAKDIAEALGQADGAAITVVANGVDGLLKAFSSEVSGQAKGSDDEIARPFAGLGANSDEEDVQSFAEPIVDAVKEQKSLNSVKTITLAISLIGTPKIASVAAFGNDEDAKDFADGVTGALTLAKPVMKDALDEKLSAVSDEPVDFTPFVNDVFDALKPQTQDNKVAVFIDLAVVEKNASLLLPLLGGKEFKSEQELESDSIDWSVADEKDESDASSDDDAQDDDPFAAPADDSDENVPEEGTDDTDDDPFGSDDDDPFA